MEKNSTHRHFPRAGLKEVMEHLPQGLDTIIEEMVVIFQEGNVNGLLSPEHY